MLGFEVTNRRALLLSFALGFIVRLIPEVLAFPHPIGYDTVVYAGIVQRGVIWSHWTSVFSTWLLYAFWIPIYNVTRADPFLLLKLTGPLLFGLSACGVYWFSRKGLSWDMRRSLMAASFFVFQLAAFRISWDLLRNTLGMAILLFALPFLLKMESWKDFAWFVLLSILVVFGHELASVVMFTVVVFGVMLNDLLKRNKAGLLKVSAAVSPSLVLFLTSMYFKVFPLQLGVKTNVINAVQPVVRPAGLFFLANYFVGSGSGSYSGYFDLASQVLSVFTVLYLLCLPLVLVGFFRNRVLDVWVLFIVCASFSCLVMPFFALNWWDRWMFLLVYPFTFYAVVGVLKVLESANGVVRPSVGWLNWMKVSKKTIVALLSSMGLLTSVYIGATLQSDNYVIMSVPTISRYFSVAPTVPLQDVSDTVKVMEWLNGNIDNGSCVLVHSAFLSWARLYLDENHTIVAYSNDTARALNVAASQGFNSVYLVWWGEDIGWYWFTVPSYFRMVFQSGRMAAFLYLG
jgi:hypothetical protein